MTAAPEAKPGDDGGEPVFMCSFCMRPKEETGLLVGAPTASICRKCATGALTLFDQHPEASFVPAARNPWDRLSDAQLLLRLPQVARARDQVEASLRQWVAAARARNVSWASIGAALGMTRQSAWERFHRGAEDGSA